MTGLEKGNIGDRASGLGLNINGIVILLSALKHSELIQYCFHTYLKKRDTDSLLEPESNFYQRFQYFSSIASHDSIL